MAQGAFKKKSGEKIGAGRKNLLIVVDEAVDVLIETGLARAKATDEGQGLSFICCRLFIRLKKEN